MQGYSVKLDTYSGPMDLLLYLIRREEVDIYDIPISRILEQYLGYVQLLKVLDPEAIGEFLVLAATLMEIKSRLLLPKPPPEEEDEEFDPRADLVRQLLAYKTYRDAAHRLGDRAEQHARRFGRPPVEMPKDADQQDVEIEDAQVWDLLAAFNQLITSVGKTRAFHEVTYDDTPITLHAADILDRLEREGPTMRFETIFEGRKLGEMVGLFLALLELIRQRRVRIEQEGQFGAIMVHLIDATPITTLSGDEPEESSIQDAGETPEYEDLREPEDASAGSGLEEEGASVRGKARDRSVSPDTEDAIDDEDEDEDEEDEYSRAIDAVTIGEIDLGRAFEHETAEESGEGETAGRDAASRAEENPVEEDRGG